MFLSSSNSKTDVKSSKKSNDKKQNFKSDKGSPKYHQKWSEI